MYINFRTKLIWIFGPNLAQKWFLGSEFKKSKSGFTINTSSISCVPIFSQNGPLLIFWPKFGEIAQLQVIFWFKYCWECCRELGGGWNELGGGWNELGGGYNELGGGRWSWVEVDGAGWRWVHSLVIPKKTSFKLRFYFESKILFWKWDFPLKSLFSYEIKIFLSNWYLLNKY